MNIRSGLVKVLKEYPKAQEDEFAKHLLANFIRHDPADAIAETSRNPDRYILKGSAGQEKWGLGTLGCDLQSITTTSAQPGFYQLIF